MKNKLKWYDYQYILVLYERGKFTWRVDKVKKPPQKPQDVMLFIWWVSVVGIVFGLI